MAYNLVMLELSPTEFHKVADLFKPFDYSLSIRATIEGNNPGRIFVNDVDHIRTAFALTVEGYLLAGEFDNPHTNQALQEFLQRSIFSGEIYINGDWSMSLAVHPANWEARLPELIPTHEIEKIQRYHYLCSDLKFSWQAYLPSGYHLRLFDQELLDDPTITIPDQIREWWDPIEMWGSLENALDKGISLCVIHDGIVVSQCTSDCMANGQIDLGIITLPEHRRRGLAACAVAATVEACFRLGFQKVGWHCNADNVASWKTAEKVGFERNLEYIYYYYVYNPIDHLSELGWYYYKQGMYEKTVAYYDRVFAQRKENPHYYYHLAALACAELEDADKALMYLEEAAYAGWPHLDYTIEQPAFGLLKDRPEWHAIIDKISVNSSEAKELDTGSTG